MTAVGAELLVEDRAVGRRLSVRARNDDEAASMARAVGAPPSWRTTIHRTGNIDLFSATWRIGQVLLVVGAAPFAAMESLHGWGFVVLVFAIVVAIMWGTRAPIRSRCRTT